MLDDRSGVPEHLLYNLVPVLLVRSRPPGPGPQAVTLPGVEHRVLVDTKRCQGPGLVDGLPVASSGRAANGEEGSDARKVLRTLEAQQQPDNAEQIVH